MDNTLVVWKPIEAGDKVIIRRGESYQVVEVRRDSYVDVGKVKIPFSQIIGYPLGSTFLYDGTNVMQVKEEEITVKGVEVESSKDNRNLTDRSDNQLLTSNDIKSLKSAGSTGNDIISKLVEKSTTFHLKTKFSQEKYLNKKKRNYLCVFSVRPHTTRHISDMHLACKNATLRYDSLTQLLTYANVHAGSTVLLTDTFSGLVGKAVLERLGHRSFGGRLINFYHGTSAPVIDIASSQQYSPVYGVQFEDVTSLLLTGMFAKEHRDQSITNSPPHKKPRLEEGEANQKLDTVRVDGPKVGSGPSGRRQERRARRLEAVTAEEKARRAQQKQEQLNEVKRILCPTDEQLSPDLQDRPDCLIVASRFYPIEVTLLLMQFLPPGRPFVVHSHVLPALVDLYNILKRRGSCVQLQLHDAWLRTMQVLPQRTHPENRLAGGGGGFVLRGYTVQRREDPDALLRRRTMRASTKLLFDEALISYAR